MKLTELEKDLLDAFCEGEEMYVEHLSGYCRKVSSEQMSGVVASLIKKGLVEQYEDTEFKMSVLSLTDKGLPLSPMA